MGVAELFKRTTRAGALAALLCSVAPAALAQAVSTAPTQGGGISQEQALALTARLDALEQHNQELENQISDLKAQVSSGEQAIRQEVHATTVSIPNGRPTFASGDGQFTAQLRGIFQLDAAHYDQSAPGPLATDFRRGSVGDAGEADHARDLNDGTNFRRARIGVEGRAFGDWEYNFLYDFGGSGVEEPGKISAAWLQYDGFGAIKVRVGAFSAPAGIEEATSTTGSLFLERASPSEVVRGIASGDGRKSVAVLGAGERWNFSAALTGGVVATQTFDQQSAFVGRVAFLPIKGLDYLVHVGANTTIVLSPAAAGPDVAPGAATPLRLRDRPEVRVDIARLVDTGNIDGDGLTEIGGELAAQKKNFSIQGEYIHIDVRRRASALSDPSFAGWYVQGAWTITGEPRRYNIALAAFDAPKVDRPFNLKGRTWGAWELAARYSDLDLNYQAGAPGTAPATSAVRGGEQKIATVGINWYPNAVVRFQADYQHVEVDRLSPGGTAFGAGALTPPAGAQIGQTLNIWSFRSQYAF
jgi:phosphate-selective porin OprO/OprP